MLSNTSLDFISDMKFYFSYFARNIYETETVTSRLRYIEDLISLENNIV